MNIKSMSLGPLGTNCYLLYDSENALIVDPGGDAEQIMAFLDEKQVVPQAILLTHAHFDHIGAVDTLRKHYQLDVYLHENEADWLEESRLNRSLLFTGQDIVTDAPDHLLHAGKMEIATFAFEVLHTPGHSPGSVSFVFEADQIVLSGDALFYQGIGRTDLPGGDKDELVNSIKNELYTLEEKFVVYPGHGPMTSIGAEKTSNPFVYI